MPRYNPILDKLPTYPMQELNRRKDVLRAAGKTLLDFGIGDPTEPVIEAIRSELGASVPPNCRYPKIDGTVEFRQAVADYVQRRFSVSLPVEKYIMPLSGAKECVFHLPQLIIDPLADDNVIIYSDPGYPAYYRGGLFAGGDPVAIPLSGDFIFRPWEIDESLLRRCRLLWINSPHNPSGAVMSLSDLQRTADLCRKFDILLVSDECYADIYSNEPPHSILECGLDNVLAVHSLSKRSGMTGYRSGFVTGDPKVIKQFRRYRSNPGIVPSQFVNAAATVAWSDDQHVKERRVAFANKKSLFIQFFDDIAWEFIGREASLYLWVRVPNGECEKEWANTLLDRGVVVSPGSMFASTDAGTGYLRIAMVPSIEECIDAINIWRELL